MCCCCGRTDGATIEADGLMVCLDCYVSETDPDTMVDPSARPLEPVDVELEASVWAILDAQPCGLVADSEAEAFAGLMD